MEEKKDYGDSLIVRKCTQLTQYKDEPTDRS